MAVRSRKVSARGVSTECRSSARNPAMALVKARAIHEKLTVNSASSTPFLEDRSGQSHSLESRIGGNLSGRLLWRLNEQGDTLSLMPSVFHTEAHSDNDFSLVQAPPRPGITPRFYDTGTTVGDSRFTNARLGATWRQRVGDIRLEMNGNGGNWESRSDTLRNEFLIVSVSPLRIFSDQARTRERSLNLTLKASGLAGGGAPDQPAAEHSLVSGAEVEAVARSETRQTVVKPKPDPTAAMAAKTYKDETRAQELLKDANAAYAAAVTAKTTTVPAETAAFAEALALVIAVTLLQHGGGNLLKLLDADGHETQHILTDAHHALHLGHSRRRGIEIEQGVMRLAVFLDPEGEGLDAPIFILGDSAAIAFDDALELLDKRFHLLGAHILARQEDMFI